MTQKIIASGDWGGDCVAARKRWMNWAFGVGDFDGSADPEPRDCGAFAPETRAAARAPGVCAAATRELFERRRGGRPKISPKELTEFGLALFTNFRLWKKFSGATE